MQNFEHHLRFFENANIVGVLKPYFGLDLIDPRSSYLLSIFNLSR